MISLNNYPENKFNIKYLSIVVFFLFALLSIPLHKKEIMEVIEVLPQRVSANPFTAIFYFLLFLYVIVTKRKNFLSNHVRPDLFSGIFILLFTFFLHYLSRISGIETFNLLSLISYLIALVFLVFGRKGISDLLLPILLLMFAFNLLNFLFSPISIYLQLLQSFLSGLVLNGLGFFTIQTGIYLELPHIILRVDPTCNGVNQISTLVILAIILITMFKITNLRRQFFLILLGAVLGVLLNTLRIVVIAIWSIFFEGDLLHGPANMFYVTSIFVVGSIILAIVARKWSHPTEVQPEQSNHFLAQENKNLLKTYSLTFFLIIIGIGFLKSSDLKPYNLENSFASFPENIQDWQSDEASGYRSALEFDNIDTYLRATFSKDSTDTLTLYMGYLPKQDQVNEVITMKIRERINQGDIDYCNGDNENKYAIHYAALDSLHSGFFWFNLNGKHESDPLQVKLTTLKDALFKRKNNGAFILVSFNSAGKDALYTEKIKNEFVCPLIPVLNEFFKN